VRHIQVVIYVSRWNWSRSTSLNPTLMKDLEQATAAERLGTAIPGA
jgi:hypothetical protein